MKLFKTRIKKSEIKAWLLLFPFVEVHVFNIGAVYDLAIAAAILYVILLFVKKQIVLKKEYIPLLLYAVWLTICCLLNHRDPIPGIFYGLKLFAFVQIVEYYIQKKDLTFLYVTRNYLAFCLVITTIIQYVKQDLFGQLEISGNYYNFSFSDNVLGYYYIPFIAVCLVIDQIKIKKISKITWAIIFLSIISLVRAWSAKAIIGIFLISIYILFIYGKKISKVFNLAFVLITYLCAEIGLVFFNIQERFSFLIERILKKDASLTGRTGLWYSSINNIKQSPLYGYGVTKGGNILLNTTFVGSQTHAAHNLILEIIMQTGIIGLILWSMFVVLSLAKRKKHIKVEGNSYYMLLFFAYIILIMQLSSGSIYLAFCYLPIILCANVNELFSEDFICDTHEGLENNNMIKKYSKIF